MYLKIKFPLRDLKKNVLVFKYMYTLDFDQFSSIAEKNAFVCLRSYLMKYENLVMYDEKEHTYVIYFKPVDKKVFKKDFCRLQNMSEHVFGQHLSLYDCRRITKKFYEYIGHSGSCMKIKGMYIL